MMRRIMACLIAIACLLTAFAALAEGDMKVIKVNQAVNMRQQTNTDSTVVAQVPLGTVLSGCKKVEGTDWYAVSYEGVSGYIREDFLESVAPAAEPAAEPASETAAEPAAEPVAAQTAASGLPEGVERPIQSITDASTYGGNDVIILDTTAAGVRVVARQIFMKDGEYVMVVGLDASGNQLWAQETLTGSITELTQTDCFMGGTEQQPLVLLYNAWTGLIAIDPATGVTLWTVLKEDVPLGASISHAVGSNGVAFIGGYYGPDPVAIDINGNVLWQTDSGDLEATWLYEIQVRDVGVAAHYYSMAGDKVGWVVYNYDGSVRDVEYDW